MTDQERIRAEQILIHGEEMLSALKDVLHALQAGKPLPDGYAGYLEELLNKVESKKG